MLDLYFVYPPRYDMMDRMINAGANILFSYSNSKSLFLKFRDKFTEKNKVFMDSGAFTLWTKGKQVDVEEYINFLNENSDKLTLFGQVDVIPGDIVHGATMEQVKEAAQATWDNYLYMRPRLKNPEGLMYTFHVGEPYEYLQRALDWRDEQGNPITYMALGGMVGKPKAIRENFLKIVYDIIQNSSNPGIKIHAFGMTNFELLDSFPITSADSSSYIMTAVNGGIMSKYGVISLSDKREAEITHWKNLPREYQENLANYVGNLGFTLEELTEDPYARQMFNYLFMLDRAKNLTRKKKPKKKSLI